MVFVNLNDPEQKSLPELRNIATKLHNKFMN